MSLQILVDISNHPLDDSIERKFSVHNIELTLGGRSLSSETRKYPTPFVAIKGSILHYKDGNELKLPVKAPVVKADNTDKVDATTGRKYPAKVKDDDPESMTYNQMVDDPSHNPTEDELSFILQMSAEESTLWAELNSILDTYIRLSDSYGLFGEHIYSNS